ncbi:MAG: Outer membrane lipoprotein Blc [Pseudomonas citronellolis]|nr:MAG: Outer membrane lipoprotein Blc [Pseudomonas citronellolis]
MRGYRWLVAALGLLGLGGCASHAEHEPSTVQVDPQRYQGTWYELARKPMFFQRNCAQSEAHYSLNADGTLGVLNRCRTQAGEWEEVQGTATPQVAGRTDKFWVRFDNLPTRLFPNLVRGNYWVLALDADYQTVLVGNPDRDYLWLLSRQPVVAEGTLRRLLAEAHSQGFDTSDLVWRVPDSQIGKP